MASIQHKKGTGGKKVYYVVIAIGPARKWLKAGTLKDAKVLLRQIEELKNSDRIQKLGLVSRNRRIDSFFQEYTDYVKLRTAPNTHKRYRAVINAFIAFLTLFHEKLKNLVQITPAIIEDYQQKRLESVELKTLADGDKLGNHKKKHLPLPQTVNYEVSVLRSAFTWALDRDLIPSVPTRKVRPLKVGPKKPRRILTPDECKKLIGAAKHLAKSNRKYTVFHRALCFILNSGLRSGELCNLTWNDIDLNSKVIKIQAKENWSPKTYEREFFLNRACLRILKSIQDREGFIFKSSTGQQLSTDDLRKVLIKFTKAAGLQGLTRVHDLRHTFSSLMQMNGVDRGTVAAILGHRDESTTLIYTHQTQEHLKKSIENVGVG